MPECLIASTEYYPAVGITEGEKFAVIGYPNPQIEITQERNEALIEAASRIKTLYNLQHVQLLVYPPTTFTYPQDVLTDLRRALSVSRRTAETLEEHFKRLDPTEGLLGEGGLNQAHLEGKGLVLAVPIARNDVPYLLDRLKDLITEIGPARWRLIILGEGLKQTKDPDFETLFFNNRKAHLRHLDRVVGPPIAVKLTIMRRKRRKGEIVQWRENVEVRIVPMAQSLADAIFKGKKSQDKNEQKRLLEQGYLLFRNKEEQQIPTIIVPIPDDWLLLDEMLNIIRIINGPDSKSTYIMTRIQAALYSTIIEYLRQHPKVIKTDRALIVANKFSEWLLGRSQIAPERLKQWKKGFAALYLSLKEATKLEPDPEDPRAVQYIKMYLFNLMQHYTDYVNEQLAFREQLMRDLEDPTGIERAAQRVRIAILDVAGFLTDPFANAGPKCSTNVVCGPNTQWAIEIFQGVLRRRGVPYSLTTISPSPMLQ